MKIRFLELQNFKSYAGLQRIGPFEDMMSCIIGPNGCGKSNIIDSLLFVFGFKSDKLRQDNLKSLIHKSSLVTATSCRVSIILETADKKQLTISRCVSQAGNSSYHIDNKRSTLEQVKNLLLEHGIDLKTNHFMILQGEIEKLAELSPKLLLGHMQYLFGSQVYIEQLENLTIQLNELQIQKHTQQQSLKGKARTLEMSKQRRDRTLLWIEQHVKTLKIQKILATIVCKRHEKDIQKLDSNIGQLEQDCRLSLELKTKEVQELSQTNKRLEKTANSLNDLKKQFKQLERLYHDAGNRLLSLRTNLEFKEKDFTIAYNKKNDTMDEINKLKEVKCEVQLPKVQKELEAAQKQLKKLFSLEQISNLNKVIRRKEELAAKQNQYEKYSREKQEIEKTLQQCKNKLQQHQLLQSQKQQTTHQVTAQINILKNQLSKQTQNRINHEETLNSIKNSILKINTSAQKESRRSQMLNELTKMAERGILKGFRGRLRDYVWVDKKHQKAFEAVCPQLDFFIVEAYSDATTASQELKKRKIGRATFVILEQIKEQVEKAMKQRFVTPPKCQRLYDIVYGDSYRNVLYWSLGDTLIAEDMKTAMPIAYGTPRYRVVTLNGDIIDISGVMTSAPPSKNIDLDAMVSKQQLIEKLLVQDSKKIEQLRQQLFKKNAYFEAISDKALGSLPQPEEIEELTQKLKYLVSICEKLQEGIVNAQPEEESQKIERYIPIKIKIENLKNKLKNLQSSDTVVQRLENKLKFEEKKEKQLEQQMIKMQNQQKELTKIQQQNNEKLEGCHLEIGRQLLDLSQCKQNQRRLEANINKTQNDSIFSKISWLKEEKQKITVWYQQNTETFDKCTKLLLSYMDNEIKEIREIAHDEQKSNLKVTQERRAIKMSQIPQHASEESQKMYKIQVTICKQKMDAIENEGPIDFESITKFRNQYQQYAKDEQTYEELKKHNDEIEKQIRQIKETRLKTFMDGFTIVLASVKEIYQQLTRGDIDLSLVDVLNPFQDGVEISVRPVNKSWKRINLLSGGQKTMTALALTFAFSRVRFCPFYLMDQIDAALDYRNTGILAQYVRNKQKSQMVVISLRRNMYELAQSLTGVYKINNCSQTLTVQRDFLNAIAQSVSSSQQTAKSLEVTPIRLKVQNTISSHSSVKRSWNGIL